MKKIFTLFLLLTSINVFALSNAEVRDALREIIDSMTFPLRVDDSTELINIIPTTRGAVFEYKVETSGDSLPSVRLFLMISESILKKRYCNSSLFDFYRTNDVETYYIYYDKSDNLIGMFGVNDNDCE